MKHVLLLSLSLFLCAGLSAQSWWGSGEKGEGPVVSKTLNVDKFKGLTLGFSGDVYLTQGAQQSVKVEGQQNIIDLIDLTVSEGHWKIRFTKSVRDHAPLKLYITVPTVDKVHISGSGNILSENKFTGLGDLSLGISGSGDIKFDSESNHMTSKISGSGDISLKGKTNKLELQISGSGDIDAFDLSSKDCNVQISGSGNCEITAEENLDVRVSGSGDVYYKGRPRINSKISGSGDLVSRS